VVVYQWDEICVENFGSICSPAKQLWRFLYRLFRKITMNTYAHLYPDAQAAASDWLNGVACCLNPGKALVISEAMNGYEPRFLYLQ
jgi:hypothetical protein